MRKRKPNGSESPQSGYGGVEESSRLVDVRDGVNVNVGLAVEEEKSESDGNDRTADEEDGGAFFYFTNKI
jgi:hypothetical protein